MAFLEDNSDYNLTPASPIRERERDTQLMKYSINEEQFCMLCTKPVQVSLQKRQLYVQRAPVVQSKGGHFHWLCLHTLKTRWVHVLYQHISWTIISYNLTPACPIMAKMSPKMKNGLPLSITLLCSHDEASFTEYSLGLSNNTTELNSGLAP